jgi:hypothetical protein
MVGFWIFASLFILEIAPVFISVKCDCFTVIGISAEVSTGFKSSSYKISQVCFIEPFTVIFAVHLHGFVVLGTVHVHGDLVVLGSRTRFSRLQIIRIPKSTE